MILLIRNESKTRFFTYLILDLSPRFKKVSSGFMLRITEIRNHKIYVYGFGYTLGVIIFMIPDSSDSLFLLI